jgi:hypothetical protein
MKSTAKDSIGKNAMEINPANQTIFKGSLIYTIGKT